MSRVLDVGSLGARSRCGVLAAAALLFGVDAFAQSTGSVGNPVVRPGSSISFATGVALDDGEDGYAQRVDYRAPLSDTWRVRSIIFFNDRGGEQGGTKITRTVRRLGEFNPRRSNPPGVAIGDRNHGNVVRG